MAYRRKLLVVVCEGGSHSIFTDRTGTGGHALNPRVKEATKERALAFFCAQVRGQHGASLTLGGNLERPLGEAADRELRPRSGSAIRKARNHFWQRARSSGQSGEHAIVFGA